jgi:hypothetical protein
MIWIVLVAALALVLVVLYSAHLTLIKERDLLVKDYAVACTRVQELTQENELLRSKRRRSQRAAVLGIIEGARDE